MSGAALSERQALLALNALPNIGPIVLNRLLDAFAGDPVAVLGASDPRLRAVKGVGPETARSIREWRGHFDLEREEERLRRTGMTFVTFRDADYPALLREIHDPPIGLYAMGGYRCENPCIAIVGSRRTTLYGQAVAREFAAELARLGFCVVSGLARGIDTAAHEGALSTNGRTAAVLGCGADIVYPPENLDLYRSIAERGVVFSEFPFGRRADRQSFPMRNRIVAGLSQAVVVVETDEKGGSMITARFAGEQGRVLFAVPGRIDQATSRGCHQLIRDGAILCTGVEDILQELNYLPGLRAQAARDKEEARAAATPEISGNEAAVWNALAGGELASADLVVERTGLDSGQVSAALMSLELKGLVTKRTDGRFEGRGG